MEIEKQSCEECDCQKPKPDNVNHPSHYESSCSLECIEVMEIMFGLQYVYCFCLCNAWKYIWRYKNKNGIEDLEKARWYIDKSKWYERNHGDEIYSPNKTLHAMDDWLLEHDIV